MPEFCRNMCCAQTVIWSNTVKDSVVTGGRGEGVSVFKSIVVECLICGDRAGIYY